MPADPWTPEDGNTLVAPPVTFYAIESAPVKIWHEWLSGWFNGEEHTLCTVDGVDQTVVFPEASQIAVNNAVLSQPIDGLGIGIFQMAQPVTMHRVLTRATKNIQLRLSWRFYIRAKVNKRSAGGENSESLCRKAAELFWALILMEENHGPIKAKGLFNVRAQPTQILSAAEWATRTTVVSATVIVGSQSSPEA
jgi:hypothetical protein